MENNITENRVMLGKITGFPRWPCVIINENDVSMGDAPDNSKNWYIVQFFNDGKYAWLAEEDLSSYEENVELLAKRNQKEKKLLSAIREADQQLLLKREDPDYCITVNRKRKIPKMLSIKQEAELDETNSKKDEQIPKRKKVNIINIINYEEKNTKRDKEKIGIVVGKGKPFLICFLIYFI